MPDSLSLTAANQPTNQPTHKAFDNRTRSTREIWRQLQAGRFHNANPNLSINTHVLGTADPPQVVFKFIDDTEVRVNQ